MGYKFVIKIMNEYASFQNLMRSPSKIKILKPDFSTEILSDKLAIQIEQNERINYDLHIIKRKLENTQSQRDYVIKLLQENRKISQSSQPQLWKYKYDQLARYLQVYTKEIHAMQQQFKIKNKLLSDINKAKGSEIQKLQREIDILNTTAEDKQNTIEKQKVEIESIKDMYKKLEIKNQQLQNERSLSKLITELEEGNSKKIISLQALLNQSVVEIQRLNTLLHAKQLETENIQQKYVDAEIKLKQINLLYQKLKQLTAEQERRIRASNAIEQLQKSKKHFYETNQVCQIKQVKTVEESPNPKTETSLIPNKSSRTLLSKFKDKMKESIKQFKLNEFQSKMLHSDKVKHSPSRKSTRMLLQQSKQSQVLSRQNSNTEKIEQNAN